MRVRVCKSGGGWLEAIFFLTCGARKSLKHGFPGETGLCSSSSSPASGWSGGPSSPSPPWRPPGRPPPSPVPFLPPTSAAPGASGAPAQRPGHLSWQLPGNAGAPAAWSGESRGFRAERQPFPFPALHARPECTGWVRSWTRPGRYGARCLLPLPQHREGGKGRASRLRGREGGRPSPAGGMRLNLPSRHGEQEVLTLVFLGTMNSPRLERFLDFCVWGLRLLVFCGSSAGLLKDTQETGLLKSTGEVSYC